MPDHKTIPVQVWIDIDVGIAEMVRRLQTIPGVRTHSSCQGTIGEGGPEPFRPFVSVSWSTYEAFDLLRSEFDLTVDGDAWGYVHPRKTGE